MPISSLGGKMLHHRGRLQNYTFPDSRAERTFCLGSGEDNEAFAGTQPPGRGPGNLPSAATAATGQPPVTSWAEGRGTKSHFLRPGTNLLGKAPAPSCGQTRAVGPMAVGRGPGRTGLLPPWKTRIGQVVIFLLTMAWFIFNNPPTLPKHVSVLGEVLPLQ